MLSKHHTLNPIGWICLLALLSACAQIPVVKGTWQGYASSIELHSGNEVYHAATLQVFSGPPAFSSIDQDVAIVPDSTPDFVALRRGEFLLLDNHNRLLDLSMLEPGALIQVHGIASGLTGQTLVVTKIKGAAGKKIHPLLVVPPQGVQYSAQMLYPRETMAERKKWFDTHLLGVIRRLPDNSWWITGRTMEILAHPSGDGQFAFQYRYSQWNAFPGDQDTAMYAYLKRLLDMQRFDKNAGFPLQLTEDQVGQLDKLIWSDPPPASPFPQNLQSQFAALAAGSAGKWMSDPTLLDPQRTFLSLLNDSGQTVTAQTRRNLLTKHLGQIELLLNSDQWADLQKWSSVQFRLSNVPPYTNASTFRPNNASPGSSSE